MHHFHPVIDKILKKRGFQEKDIENFLSWDLKTIPDLTSLKDLKLASERIIKAKALNQKIAIYGDYDVDGTTSCALLYHFFKMIDVDVTLMQPSRFVEGYGLHLSSIKEAKENNIEILITVDCGITNNEAALYAKECNIDLIITDHHKDAREEMPRAYAIINPNRRDETCHQELKALAGVTVAFALAVQIRNDLNSEGENIESLYPLLQFVAIGTICDLAFLNPTNLKLTRHGLKQFKETKFAGLRAFFTEAELNSKIITSEKLAFNIGPLINSKGRLDHPEIALRLLIASNLDEARPLYDQLVICNNERKFIQSEDFKIAKEEVLKNIDHYKRNYEQLISIIYHPNFHEGVIGIVASKLVETFKVPAIVFTNAEEEGVIKASARSAGDLDLFSLLNKCSHLFIKFGGHKAAAGLSMKKENLKEFEKIILDELKNIPSIVRTETSSYDLEIEATDISPKLMKDLEMLEPFGIGNEKPIFKLSGVKLDSYDLMKEIHVKWNLSKEKIKMKGVSFNYVGKYEALNPQEIYSTQNLKNEDLSVFFTLTLNRFNGNESIQLMIDRLEFGNI